LASPRDAEVLQDLMKVEQKPPARLEPGERPLTVVDQAIETIE
jgi:hypothetical protein